MRKTTLTLATTLVFSLTGAAFAQAPAGGGSATGNMNNPGSVKSNGEKMNEMTTGSTMKGTAGAPGAVGGSGNMGGGTGASSNTGVGLGAAGNTQAPRQ